GQPVLKVPGLGGCPGLALTACLLCADPSLPRPSISLSPTWVTAPGADATIRCQGQRRDVRFFLHKAGDLNPQRHMDPAGAGAEFHIPTVGRQHGGSYSCSYRPQSEPFISSYASSYVELVVAEPKPNISLHPRGRVAPGGAVTIRCECWCRRARFLLSKAGDPDARRSMDPAGDVAEFPIHSVSRGDAGSYSCRYSTKSNAPVWSEPSDPVELVVAGEGPGSASPLPSAHPDGPSGDLALVGSSEPGSARRLFLYKGGIEIRELDAAGDGGEFTIPSARRDDGGAYSCRSRSRSEPPNWSDPSDIVRIIVAGERSGLGSPHPVALGGAVTVQCWGWHQNMRFRLYKDGNPTALQDAEPAGDLAEFPIRNVSRRDAGSYSCSYQDKLYLFNWSHPSDPVELVVAGEGPGSVSPGPGSVSRLPAPHPARPSGGLSDTQPYRRDGITGAFPSHGGAAATRGSGQREGGSLPPGGAAEKAPFPRGMLPRVAPVLGTHQGVGAWGKGNCYGNRSWCPGVGGAQTPGGGAAPDPQLPQCLLPCRSLPGICWGIPGEGQDLGGWAVKLGPAGYHSPGAITPPSWAT
uniref:Ig-like domain-containing protein n=1 Tax=Chelydra serpentina TaxID=8475 RepID=A0A8C3SSA5_CHESE